uniref:RNA 2-O ribose methyltransferase substrate binding domain-containing protein n=1 Tax=Oreochromis aureus TaxID=47969 RepID=A0A668SXE5_OREAU
MAAYTRGMICVISMIERHGFLTTRGCVTVESKRYVRGLRRKPVRVLFPENETGKVVKAPQIQSDEPKIQRETRGRIISAATEHHEEKNSVRTRTDAQSATKHAFTVTKNEVDGLRYERASPGDKRLARLVSVARSRTFRDHQGKILLEGRRLICDALDAGAKPQTVFFSTVDRLRELPLDKLRRATLVKVKFEDIKLWSDVVAPQGVIAIFSRPDPSQLNFASKGHSVPLSLICDNIRDPGNLGTMLRCAAAAGCHNVLLTKGCVDVWEPKVLRAAMGAHFRLPIYPSLDWDDVENHLPKPVTVHVADNYGWVSTRPNCKNMEVDTKLYYDSWAQSPTALVIGGETHGLSLEAVQLAEKTDGHRLFIPVVPDVDSLNSAMAASILLFEGRKQLLKLLQTSGKKRQCKAERQFP